MRTSSLTASALVLALGAIVPSALAGISANAKSEAIAAPMALPAALRPALYRALAAESGPGARIDSDGCVVLPKQHLEACFDANGAHFNGGATPLSLRLAALGRTNATNAFVPGSARPLIAGNRIRYRFGDGLTEWWRVLPIGFEQGFTIARRPAGHGELTLALAASSGAQNHGEAFGWGGLRYGGLVVTDARGRIVPATMKTTNDRILIAVNDRHAVYPLTVDPLVWLEQKVTSSDGAASDSFGWSNLVAGSTAFIGAAGATVAGNSSQGAVYVFTRNDGVWAQTQKLTASDGAASDRFGAALAVSGTTLFVGANGAAVNGNAGQGAAYVFTKSGNSWSESQKLTASDGAAGDDFAFVVRILGSTAIIGAPFATVHGNSAQGAAYIFTDGGSSWSQTAKLTADDGVAGNEFGEAAALYDGGALISALFATVNGNSNQGAVYAFEGAGASWTQEQKLISSDGAAGDEFGSVIAASGTTALITAIAENSLQGAAYVFTDDGGSWSQTQKLTASDGAPSDFFGYSASLNGTTAIIGAPFQTVNGNSAEGAAYLFEKSGGSWNEEQKLLASDGTLTNFVGWSVAVDDSGALVGAIGESIGGNPFEGAAYFYGQSDLGLTVSAPGTVGQGQQFVSQTIATNNASAASPAVTATIGVPAAASFVAASATQGSCSEASGLVTCDFGAIDGNAGTATANVTLKASGNVGDTIDNTASVARSTPPLRASAATEITGTQSCPDGYTSYSGTLAAGSNVHIPPYGAPAGEEDAILYAPEGFRLYGRVDATLWGRYQRGFPVTEVHRHGPTGEYSWLIRASDAGGNYLFCLMHP